MTSTTLRWSEVAGAASCHVALVPIPPSGPPGLVHDHADFHELFYVTAGHGLHHVHDVAHPVGPGDLVLVRPHDRHVLRADPAPDPLTIINVAFPTAAWAAFAGVVGLGEAAAWDAAPVPPRVSDAGGVLAPVMARMLDRRPTGSHSRELAGLWLAAAEILLGETGGATPWPATAPEWLGRACAAMRLEDNLRAGMPRFVRLAGVSHGHLARTTRTYLGCSPVEFLARARVDLAASLLETTAEPVGRIAQRCGFSSQAYFARVFCRVRGSSPRAYRSAVRRRVVP